MIGTVNPARRFIVAGLLAGGLAGLSLYALAPARLPAAFVQTMHAASSQRPATVVRPLSCVPLADLPGKAVMTLAVTFPPDAYTPAHRHPGSLTAYVLEGTVRSQLAGGPAILYGKGETWFEPKGIRHLFAENASATNPAEILAVMIADENCGPLVIPDP